MSGKNRPNGPRRDDPVSVTTAAEGRSADLAGRQRRYLIMMAARLACLPLAVVTDGWLRWVFIAGAVVLPYIAVVIANATGKSAAGTLSPVPTVHRAELPAASRTDDRISE